jgi:hypothetical protein
LEDLRQNSWAAKEFVEEMDLEPKLEKRMLAALTAIRDNQADFEKAQSLECDTIDERRFNVQIHVSECTTGRHLSRFPALHLQKT